VNNVVDEAIKAALSRRMPAHITIPKDIQEWDSSQAVRTPMNLKGHSADIYASPHPVPRREEFQAAADIINAGKKVAILVGRGCLDARAEVLELADKAAAPIVKALLGKAVVPDDSPYTTGGIGLLGTSASADVMKNCDTLFVAGSAFPYMEFLPKPGQAKVVQIDLDPTRIGLRVPADVGLAGDCKTILQHLLPLVQRKQERSFLEMAQEGMKQWNELLKERGTRTDKPMKPQVVAYHVNKFLTEDTLIVSDTGTITTWASRYLMIRGNMKFSTSGLLASMANGLPYSVGAAVGNPGKPVVAMVGDGGFTMLMCEMATIAKYQLPVKVFVFKNNTLGQIKWEQMVLEGNPEFGCDLHPIDFAGIARACGAVGFTLDDPNKAEEVIGQAFRTPGPVVVEAVVDPYEPPLPGNITVKQALHFAESLARGEKDRMKIIKTVIEDKIREVV